MEYAILFLLKNVHPYLWWGKNSLSIKPHSENISKLVHLENLSLLFFFSIRASFSVRAWFLKLSTTDILDQISE